MTGAGHKLSGATSGIPLAYLVFNYTGDLLCVLLCFITCYFGSTAPDWLEIPITHRQGDKVVTRRLLKHRGITHVLSLWVGLLCFAWFSFEYNYFAVSELILSGIFGFAAGGILHWFGDVLNKQKVPVFTPFDGVALRLFESGRFERLTCFVLLCASTAFVAYNDTLLGFFGF